MKIKRIITLTIIAFSACTITITSAFFGGILEPGDHVFDAKRFADSLKETAEMLKTVQNTLDNLKNRIIANTSVDPYTERLNTELDKINPPDGDSLINPNNEYESSPFGKSWSYTDAVTDKTYAAKLTTELSNTKKETTDVLQQAMNNQDKRYELNQDIQSLETVGILGEKQKNNAVEIASVLAGIDKTTMTGASFINNIANQEATSMVNRIDQQKIKAGEFYGYDPYNPNEYDLENRPAPMKPIGFAKFGE